MEHLIILNGPYGFEIDYGNLIRIRSDECSATAEDFMKMLDPDLFTVKIDKNGNWNLISEKETPSVSSQQ